MIDILAILDVAIEEVGSKVRSSSRSSRQGGDAKTATATGKTLKSREVPAPPAVPVKNDAIHDGIEGTRADTRGAVDGRAEVARVEYTLQNAGITGSTGSSEDSCGVKSSRKFTAHGNYGDTPASGGEGGPAPMPAAPGSANRSGHAEDKSTAIAEYDGDAVREREGTSSEPTLLAPGIWFDRFGPPGESPLDQPCPSRRGLVERRGAVFLHFCVTCGAWGAFGYGAIGDRPGRWYCREHRPGPEP